LGRSPGTEASLTAFMANLMISYANGPADN